MKKSGVSLKIFSVAAMAVLTGCGGIYNDYDLNNPDPLDRPAGRTKKDFIQNITPAPKESKIELKEPPIPKMSDVLSAPRPPKIASQKTVTISVTDDIQLKDVFLELSRLADIDIEVDPRITGGVIFKAKDRPIGEVIERITELAGLRYSLDNGVIRIENDNPYIETYKANFLNLIRTNKSQIGVNTKLQNGGGTSGGGGAGGGGQNGSETSIDSKSGGTGDIWGTLEKELGNIASSRTNSITSGGPAGNGGGAPAQNRPGGPQGGAQQGGAGGAAGAAPGANDTFVSMNREAGVITVKATERNQRKIKEYLDRVKYYYSSQVLIEAKVVEVQLNDEFRSGIDWTLMGKNANGKGFSADAGTLPNAGFTGFPGTDVTDGNILKLDFVRGDITAAVDLAQIFGSTRTLSSPRVLVMNNQQAIISFARNENYFTVQCTQTDPVLSNGDVSTPAKIDVTSTLNTIPVGVILTLQAAVDNDQNEITMNVRPTLSRLTGKTTSDPATAICIANAKAQAGDNADDIPNIESLVPQVDIREMDSILRLKNNEVMVIGGMIEQQSKNNDTGVPWASDVPILGNAFKSVDKDSTAVQTVIFLKATIVPGYGVDGSDQNFYNKFTTDPRPFDF